MYEQMMRQYEDTIAEYTRQLENDPAPMMAARLEEQLRAVTEERDAYAAQGAIASARKACARISKPPSTCTSPPRPLAMRSMRCFRNISMARSMAKRSSAPSMNGCI